MMISEKGGSARFDFCHPVWYNWYGTDMKLPTVWECKSEAAIPGLPFGLQEARSLSEPETNQYQSVRHRTSGSLLGPFANEMRWYAKRGFHYVQYR